MNNPPICPNSDGGKLGSIRFVSINIEAKLKYTLNVLRRYKEITANEIYNG